MGCRITNRRCLNSPALFSWQAEPLPAWCSRPLYVVQPERGHYEVYERIFCITIPIQEVSSRVQDSLQNSGFPQPLTKNFLSTLPELNQSSTGGVSEETFKCSAFPRGRESFTKAFQNCLQILPRNSKDSSAWKERQWGGNVTELCKITSVMENGIGNACSLHRRTWEQQIVD